ncbi:hypothetical protein DERF_005051 [Dermatophagoides farinae]|uniref:Uncharacterized protein n=1 Tax=Dermatophagoides farinae TaxID=6954 RepID=A0A922I372_DERFA|nr:hypothetical protein DERF_005051 [Dermatophagoides farinae]
MPSSVHCRKPPVEYRSPPTSGIDCHILSIETSVATTASTSNQPSNGSNKQWCLREPPTGLLSHGSTGAVSYSGVNATVTAPGTRLQRWPTIGFHLLAKLPPITIIVVV